MFEKKAYQKEKGTFFFGAWTGHEEGHGATFRLSCGFTEPWVLNTCVSYFPSAEPDFGRVVSASALAGFMRAMVLAWEPDWAIATSASHRDRVSADGKAGTFTGWIMYFPRSRGPVPPLPAPVKVEPVEDKGTLVTLTPERFTASNPGHVALAERVRQELESAGMLKPLHP